MLAAINVCVITPRLPIINERPHLILNHDLFFFLKRLRIFKQIFHACYFKFNAVLIQEIFDLSDSQLDLDLAFSSFKLYFLSLRSLVRREFKIIITVKYSQYLNLSIILNLRPCEILKLMNSDVAYVSSV